MSPEHEGKNTGLEKLRLGKSTLRKVLVSAIIGTSSSLSDHQSVIISQVDNNWRFEDEFDQVSTH